MSLYLRTRPRLAIMGTRGVPAAHGGFETFAARLAPYLASNGWDVSVYCQEDDSPPDARGGRWQSTWEGVRRIHIAVGADTPVSSIRYDLACIADVVKHPVDVVLLLGYNTAVFVARLRVAGIPVVINMDGIEWTRQKWGLLAKAWLNVNELAGCVLARHLIADHPHIERHLSRRARREKITVIPYGADLLEPQNDDDILRRFGVARGQLITLIARPEPENSILEIVRAFSRKARGVKLLVLGRYNTELVRYHAAVVAAAGDEVVFAGPVYEKSAVRALRRHSLFYIHGHQVGGCNPSLVEAMGAGNAVIAHDNHFNRWVVQDGALYFDDESACAAAIEQLLGDAEQCRQRGALNRMRARAVFDWSDILQSYDDLLVQVASEGATEVESDWGRRPYWQLDVDTS